MGAKVRLTLMNCLMNMLETIGMLQCLQYQSQPFNIK
jgi:hypothetical protein